MLFFAANPNVVLTSSMLFLSSCLPGSEQNFTAPTGATMSSLPTQATSTSSNCACPVLTSSPTASPTHLKLGLLKVMWTTECHGHVEVFPYQHLLSVLVCHGSNVSRVFKTVCQERRGCKGAPRWQKGETAEMGYLIQETGITENNCYRLQVQCTGRSTSTNAMV